MVLDPVLGPLVSAVAASGRRWQSCPPSALHLSDEGTLGSGGAGQRVEEPGECWMSASLFGEGLQIDLHVWGRSWCEAVLFLLLPQ